MKKKSAIMVILILSLVLMTAATAGADDSGLPTRASAYLSTYSIGIIAEGNNVMCVDYSVRGVTQMDTIGITQIYVEKRNSSGQWVSHATYSYTSYPSFRTNDARLHGGSFRFTGTAGVSYRATITAYAKGYDGGSDSKTLTSGSAACYK